MNDGGKWVKTVTTPSSVEYAPLSCDPLTGTRMVDRNITLPQSHVETFPNPNPGRDFVIRIRIPEFTCLCPVTGQPDFAEILLEYIPEGACVELKSLKLYTWSFRERGCFHEAVTNEIADTLACAMAPRFLRVTGTFNVRGGLYTSVVAEHRAPGWTPWTSSDCRK